MATSGIKGMVSPEENFMMFSKCATKVIFTLLDIKKPKNKKTKK